jgi:hypothetical protein
MFYLNGIPICIRQLEDIDLKSSFYSLMSLTSEENIQMINTYTFTELYHKLNNDHKIFVIINLNINDVIGTGTIKILNNKSIYNICIIKDIKIHKDYNSNNDDLYTMFLQSLIDYSCYQERCVKYIVENDDDK